MNPAVVVKFAVYRLVGPAGQAPPMSVQATLIKKSVVGSTVKSPASATGTVSSATLAVAKTLVRFTKVSCVELKSILTPIPVVALEGLRSCTPP